MTVVIFDFDGTLVDSAPDIHAAANALLRSISVEPLSADTIRSFIGNGIPKLVERVMRHSGIRFSTERHDALTQQFLALYTEKPADLTVCYPGVRALLSTLAHRGVRLGICTNKNHALTLRVLDALDLGGYFGAVIGGDSLATRKPDPAPLFACRDALGGGDVIYLGDSEVDAATAVAAGVPFGLFSGGYRTSPVTDIPHDFVCSDFNAVLAELLQRLKLAGA